MILDPLNEQLSQWGRIALCLLASNFWQLFLLATSYYQEEKKKQLRLVLVRNREKRIFPGKIPGCFSHQRVSLWISGTLLVNLAISVWQCFFSWEKPLPFIHILVFLKTNFGAALFLQLTGLFYAGM